MFLPRSDRGSPRRLAVDENDRKGFVAEDGGQAKREVQTVPGDVQEQRVVLRSGEYGHFVDIISLPRTARKATWPSLPPCPRLQRIGGSGSGFLSRSSVERERAGYGDRLVDQLARDLTNRFGRGFFPRQCISDAPVLPGLWKHSRQLSGQSVEQITELGTVQTVRLKIRGCFSVVLVPLTCVFSSVPDDNEARDYYEHEALRGGWSVRDLDRQIATKAYQRLHDGEARSLR